MNRYATMIAASMLLGGIGIFTKLTAHSIPLLTLNFLRLAIGAGTLFFLLLYYEPTFLDNWKKKLRMNLFGGGLIAISFSLYVAANTFGPVTNAVILLYTNPLIILFLAFIILKEQITRDKIIAFIGGFIGVILINPFSSGTLLGNLCALGAALVYAGYIVYLRKKSMKHSLGHLFWSLLLAAIYVLPLSVGELYMGGEVRAFIPSMLWVIPLGVLSTAFAYLLYTYSLEQLESEVGAIISMIVTPLVAILLAILLFSEIPTLRTLIGGLVLLGSLVYLQQRLIFCKKCKQPD